MKSEIKIILEKGKSNKAKGNCFEGLIRNLLSIHQYDIRGNINFSGMEIDLIADHKHKSEILYVECKAKEKVSSDELSKFCFNVSHRKADSGYFFRTNELEYQAGALLKEIKEDERYKNLSFFEPGQIIKILSDARLISEPQNKLSQFLISKKILAVTYLGDFFIYLINSSNAFPTNYLCLDAKNADKLPSKNAIELLESEIDEISGLTRVGLLEGFKSETGNNKNGAIETISEVQESENWYDYLPASSEKDHFVGRDTIRTEIMRFFTSIQKERTKKRIFYLNGKSGWGKSSLVLEINNRCRNKYYRNRFYSVAIDTRSATSDNFVALSLKKIINRAIEDKFISKDIFFKDVRFTSNFDLLSSESVLRILENLNAENKFFVLIFDQFEDVFRKKDLFKSFYKFLSDVTDKRVNIIVGFSWKSEIIIPIDHEAYQYWQQAKEQAVEFTISEFGEKEIDGVIKQLEGSVGNLSKSIKNRIKESSQGLPWLTKKLCIHIFDQIKSGIDKESLLESNLNIAELFKKDEESIASDELRALRIIAKRAFESNFFDETEVGDLINSVIISSLLNKRLVIRSGANYNIYWDIFRDYLVTREIPQIGESYLLRQMVNSCIDVFCLFDDSGNKETLESLSLKHKKGIGEEGLYNILIELRNIGLVKKEGDFYSVSKDVEISKEGFSDYITKKFKNYSPYLTLNKLDKARITKDTVLQTLKNTFKQDFQDNTWDAYAKNLISWFMASKLEIRSRIIEPKKGRGISKYTIIESPDELLPRSSFKEISEIIPLFVSDLDAIHSKYHRDLMLIGLIDENKELTKFGKEIIQKNEEEQKDILRTKIVSLPKMKSLEKKVILDKKIKAKDIVDQMPDDFFAGKAKSSKILYASKALSWLR